MVQLEYPYFPQQFPQNCRTVYPLNSGITLKQKLFSRERARICFLNCDSVLVIFDFG